MLSKGEEKECLQRCRIHEKFDSSIKYIVQEASISTVLHYKYQALLSEINKGLLRLPALIFQSKI